MNWFETVGKALAAKFGINFSEDTTEAELVDMVESIEGIESLTAQNAELSERLEYHELLSTEMHEKISTIENRANNNAKQLQEMQATIDSMKTTITQLAGKPLQAGHDSSQPTFTKSEQAANSALKTFSVTINQ